MDTEIWSQTDIRNGRIIATLLFLGILGREIYALAALAVDGLPFVAPIAADLPFIGTDLFFQILVSAGIQILLLLLVFRGHRVARWGLGVFLLISAGVFVNAVYASFFDMPPEEQIYIGLFAGIGLLGGLAFLFSPPIQAFVWFQSVQRQTIPIPLDEEGAFVGRRRRVGALNMLMGIIGGIGTAALVGAALVVAAYLLGLPEMIREYR